MKKSLVVLFLISLTIGLLGCDGKREADLNMLSDKAVKQVIKSNPALSTKPIRINGMFNSAGTSGIDSCACLSACDGNGENCSACFCDPTGCGSCP